MLLTALALAVVAWTAVIVVVAAACASAARGDRVLVTVRHGDAEADHLRLLG